MKMLWVEGVMGIGLVSVSVGVRGVRNGKGGEEEGILEV